MRIIDNNIVYIKNVLVLFSDNIIKLVIGFVISVFIAKKFGPGRFGQINYVLAYIAIFQTFVQFGFDNIILKDFGIKLFSESIIMSTVIKCRLILASIMYLFGFVFFLLIEASFLRLFIVLGLQLFTYSFWGLKQWFQIKSLNKYTVFASQISLYVVTTSKILFVVFYNEILLYASIIVLGLIIEVIILICLYKKISLNHILGSIDISYCKHLFRASFPLLLSGVSTIILMKTSQIIVGRLLSPKDLGVYSIGITISELVYFVPIGIINAMYPKIANARKEKEKSDALIIKVGSISVLFCLFFSLFCNLFMPFLVKNVYGNDYVDAGKIIQIYSWTGVFIALGTNHACYLIFEELQKYHLYSIIFGAVINIILCYFLSKHWGINGAAIAALISQVFTNYICFGLFKDKRSFFMRTKSLLFQFNQ